ncbi:prolyl oligopeptidase family serine peptidase [Micromonospora sp. PSH03]|uniref:extracellular catalytic domain type 1 short-chain-length polyhydroxyalkanoate depolymerase n=1 Tax=Micromonospora salmantinae TaxID=2911211 RepID=UPI001EE8E937|nr:PHB depolymerase family esterase [Micromonospora salmantinae]MCG5456437.1 prolyl oligopeptidase family serine peptidase [Micromonospora salmantinae]
MTSPPSAPDADAEPTRPPRRRWLRIVSGVLVTVVAAVSVGVAALQLGLPWQMGEGDRNHVYDGDAGSQRYQVHLPPHHDGTARLPVVMAIHGCGMTGYGWNSMKSTTQFNRLADREGFIVAYPTQLISRNVIACWNSTDPREQHRDSGEPALLAGVARQVVEKYDADPDQVHVAGASSGAGTAVILAATYPDVFATATSVAGGEYGLNQVDPDNPDSTSPLDTARQAWAQMGERARRVPLLVIQGEQDEVVPPLVATRLVAHWTAVGDLVDDGLPNNSLDPTEETVSVPAEAGRHAYTHSTITAPDGSPIVEAYRVQNMGHAWPGPDGDGRYTDHAGPDASQIVWEFAERHPMR